MIDSKLITDGIRSVLENVGGALPKENVNDAYELLEHAEWGESLSLICTQLYEYDVMITGEIYEQIERLGQQMEMSPDEWTMLKELRLP